MKKKTIGFIIAGVLLIGGCASMSDEQPKVKTSTSTSNVSAEESIEWLKEHEEEINEALNSYTLAQQNAIEKAEDYLDYSGFSRSGLIDQLEFEGFSNEDSTFAVDNVDVDWNEECAEKAQSYMDYSSFSRQGLIDQLEFEGFTSSQIDYGIAAVGY